MHDMNKMQNKRKKPNHEGNIISHLRKRRVGVTNMKSCIRGVIALPCQPRVRAGLYTPRGLLPKGAPIPQPSGSSMLPAGYQHCQGAAMPMHKRKHYALAGDKQLSATPRPYQPQGAQSSAPSLTTMPPLGRVTRGGWARGLHSGLT